MVTQVKAPNVGKTRDKAADIMKGIAILAVILGHCVGIPLWLHRLIYSFHLPLFFLIGGYFYRSSKGSLQFKKDFKRLIVPYFAVMTIICLYAFVAHYVIRSDHSHAYVNFFATIFPTGLTSKSVTANSVPIWFLFALFWCREIFNFLYRTLNKFPRYIVIIILPIVAIIFYESVKPAYIELPFAFIQGLSAILFFATGHIIRKYKQGITVRLSIAGGMFWCFGFMFSNIEMIKCTYNLLDFTIAVCGTYCIYKLSELIASIRGRFLFIPNVLSWYGKVSLVILCAHTIERYLPIWNWIYGRNFLIEFTIKVIVCTIMTYLCFKNRLTRKVFGL